MKSNQIYKRRLNHLPDLLINVVLFFEVSNLKKLLKEELLKHCQDLKTVLSVGDNCNVDCYELF
jgi:hypothetical protein